MFGKANKDILMMKKIRKSQQRNRKYKKQLNGNYRVENKYLEFLALTGLAQQQNGNDRIKSVSLEIYPCNLCNLKNKQKNTEQQEKQQQQIEGTPAFQELIRGVKIITHGNHARPLQSTEPSTCAETVPSSGGLLIQGGLREERTHLPMRETWA